MMTAEDIAQRREDRTQVIYGHADLAKQVIERAAIEAQMQSLQGSGDTKSLSLLKMKRDNLGRKVTLETFIALEGSDPKKWQVKPTCSCCGDDVFLHGVNSLRTTTKYMHPPIDPATKPEERCRLRSNLQRDDESSSGSKHVSARENRSAFYQPEIVGQFVQVARAILGRNAYGEDALRQTLKNADALKVWDKVHDPDLAPYQLLGLENNRYRNKFHNGTIDDVSFMVEKRLTPEDHNKDSLVPSDVRLYGRFTDRLYQGEGRLHHIPGLADDNLRKKLLSTQRAATLKARGITHEAQVPMFIGPPEPLTAHYGRDRAGNQFVVVGHATTRRLAPFSYTGMKQAQESGATISLVAQSFIKRVDALMQEFAAGPVRDPRKPRTRTPSVEAA